MENEVLADKEISDYLDKYDISYWNTLITKLAKIGIRTLIKEDPNIYTIDEIDNVLKKNIPNEEKEEENNIYETHDTKSLSINDLNSEREIPIKKNMKLERHHIQSQYIMIIVINQNIIVAILDILFKNQC